MWRFFDSVKFNGGIEKRNRLEGQTKVVGATFMTPDNAGSINRTPTKQKSPKVLDTNGFLSGLTKKFKCDINKTTDNNPRC